jgi:hypothetical protein
LGEDIMAKFYSLNWQDFFDELFDEDYPVSEYNVSGDDNLILVREQDKEKLLDEMSKHLRKLVENIIEEVDDEIENEIETED